MRITLRDGRSGTLRSLEERAGSIRQGGGAGRGRCCSTFAKPHEPDEIRGVLEVSAKLHAEGDGFGLKNSGGCLNRTVEAFRLLCPWRLMSRPASPFPPARRTENASRKRAGFHEGLPELG